MAIIRRIARMEAGQFGDHKYLQDDILELKIDVGAGYRIYYAHVGGKLILLTHAGDKSSQNIKRAIRLLKDWRIRNGQN